MDVLSINRIKARSIKERFETEEHKFLSNELFVAIYGIHEFRFHCSDIQDKENIVVISITEPDGDILSKRDNPYDYFKDFHDVLEIQFWDLESDIDGYKILTDDQGKELNAFINANKDKRFLIHCKAGVSRSAGVGCAVECIVNHNGDAYEYQTSHSDIKEFWRYAPNLTVFDKIIKIKV